MRMWNFLSRHLRVFLLVCLMSRLVEMGFNRNLVETKVLQVVRVLGIDVVMVEGSERAV